MKLQGIKGVKGLAKGVAVVWKRPEIEVSSIGHMVENAQVEIRKLERTLLEAEDELDRMIRNLETEGRAEESKIIKFQRMLLMDMEIIEATKKVIISEKMSAEAAFVRIMEKEISNLLLEEAESEGKREDYFAARVLDYRDLVNRVVRIFRGQKESYPILKEDSILVVNDITPTEIIQFARQGLRGLILEKGTPTSHSVIIALQKKIPTVLSLGKEIDIIREGDLILMDGTHGMIILNPNNDELVTFEKRQQQGNEEVKFIESIRKLPAVTLDGVNIHLEINIGRPEEIDESTLDQTDGVGLWRTEFLFLDRTQEPDEEEQMRIYQAVSQKFLGRFVNIRTLDAGGDKNLSYLPLIHEHNPSLGIRGIRLGLKYEGLLKKQLRAILRANLHGNLRLMLPLVSKVEEVEKVKVLVDQCREELMREGHETKGSPPIGIMVEVPSVAMTLDIFIPLIDFLSVGTNDLIQYLLALDRQNEELLDSYSPFYPAIIRLLKGIAQITQKANKELSICGEMAANPLAVPLLIGLGFRRLSISPIRLPEVKSLILQLNVSKCRKLAERILNISRRIEIEQTLATFIKQEMAY
ncbi:MAG: phosphoenolpyruvate--protein phosphotransferase [Candidatus Methanomethylicaceae archaeon]